MHLEQLARQWNGVIPSRALSEAGISEYRQRLLCAAGALQRVRRGWLATSDADPILLRAAECGGVVTCMTQARRWNLWTIREESSLHLALRSHGHAPRDTHGLHLHWSAPVLPRDPWLLEDGVVNVLAEVARCVPEEEAHIVWESALNRGLVELGELQRLPLRGAARRLAGIVSPYADSGLETIVARRLRRVLDRLGIAVRAQTWILGHHVDLLVGSRLVVQIDGGTHVGAQRTSDIRHDAQLVLNGYHVIRVGYVQVTQHWQEVQDTLLRAVAQGLAEPGKNGRRAAG